MATKKKPAPKARIPRPQQTEVPGTERKRVPAIEDAANHLATLRVDRMELQEQEEQAQADLAARMIHAGLKVYRYDTEDGPKLITLKELTKVSVTKAKTPKAQKADAA